MKSLFIIPAKGKQKFAAIAISKITSIRLYDEYVEINIGDSDSVVVLRQPGLDEVEFIAELSSAIENFYFPSTERDDN